MSDQQQQQQAAPALLVKGSPEYVKAMAAKWDAAQASRPQPFTPATPAKEQPAATPAKAERPAWFPENLWKGDKSLEENAQALATSYGEARKAISQRQQPNQPAAQPQPSEAVKQHAEQKAKLEADLKAIRENPEAKYADVKKAEDALAAHEKAAPKDDQAAQDAVKAAGLDWDTLQSKLQTQGALDEADIAALEKAGIPRDVTEGYVEIVKEALSFARERTATYVGGEQKLNAILNRAAAELTADEKKLFNAQLASKESWKGALDILKQRFGDETDAEAKGMIFNGQPSGSQGGFANQQEMVVAMRDPRYKTDPAYRNSVRARVAVSKF